MIVSVNTDLCTGHGRCYALAPTVFGADDYGHCEVVVERPATPELQRHARLGAENCPERAIVVAED